MKQSDKELQRIYEEFRLASVYSDVADFTERLKLMSFKGNLKDNALTNLASLTKAALEAAAYPLNNN